MTVIKKKNLIITGGSNLIDSNGKKKNSKLILKLLIFKYTYIKFVKV